MSCLPLVDRRIAGMFRWWSLPVSALNLAVPLTVSPDMTINEVLELLNKEGYDQVPVIDDSG